MNSLPHGTGSTQLMTVAITEAIATLADAERLLQVSRTEDETLFQEWQIDLPGLSVQDTAALTQLRQRYIYQRSEGQLLEGTVTLLLTSPLLAIAGFYDPPFKIRAEESVQLRLNDGEEILQGRIDALVLLERLWVIVLESKKSALSVWTALPQSLAYLAANPRPELPSFGMLTNGDEILFVKLVQSSQQYALSRVFSPFAASRELHRAMQILKHVAQLARGTES